MFSGIQLMVSRIQIQTSKFLKSSISRCLPQWRYRQIFWKMLILAQCLNGSLPISNLKTAFTHSLSLALGFLHSLLPTLHLKPLVAFGVVSLISLLLAKFPLCLSQKCTYFNNRPALRCLLYLLPFHSGLSPRCVICSLPLCHRPFLGCNTPLWASNF